MRYVISWGNDWHFETVPAHMTDPFPADGTYVSKDAAVNAAINQMIRTREVLDEVIRSARRRQQRLDRRRSMSERV